MPTSLRKVCQTGTGTATCCIFWKIYESKLFQKTAPGILCAAFTHYYRDNANITHNRHWCFKTIVVEKGAPKAYTLRKLSDIPIVRYVKVKKDANPFDPIWYEYFESRREKRLRWKSKFDRKRVRFILAQPVQS